nr:MAG: CI repressor [Bacteriophage sp.]
MGYNIAKPNKEVTKMKDISEQMKDIMLRIKSRRESLDLSFQQLADLTGMSKSTLQRYETGGIKNIPLDKLEVLAKALQTSPEWILGWNRKMDDWDKAVYKFFPDFIPGKNYISDVASENKEEDQATPLPQTNVFMRPVYDSISAGFGVIAQDVPVDYMPTYITCPSEQDKYIWINVHGDSMSPLIDDGSKILIKKQTSVDSGQIAAVLVDDEEAVVKKVLYNDNTVELHSVNPYYPPRVFKNNDVTRVQILGLVKEVSKSLQ